MVKTKVMFIILMLAVIGFSFYYFKLRTPYKYYVELPEVLTEESCMEVLKVYQPDISDLEFEKGGSENFTYKQLSFDIDGLLPNGRRTITFTYPNQQFEGCNILDTYTVEKLTKEPNFKQYFDCKNLECKDIKCDGRDARLFYTYRKINDYYELKYYMREPISIPIEEPPPGELPPDESPPEEPPIEEGLPPEEELSTKPGVSVTVQFLYFNRPLDKFIKHREESVCRGEE